MTPLFTQDWFSRHIPLWYALLHSLRGRPVHVLEVGVFEGKSTLWLFENILTHHDSRAVCIDTFAGGPAYAGMDISGLASRFRCNTKAHASRLDMRVGASEHRLRELPLNCFDFISIDGSHDAPDVLSDAVLSWPLLKAGGLLAFDDYEWKMFSDPHRCPKLGIDAFLTVMFGRFETIHKGYQVWVRKH